MTSSRIALPCLPHAGARDDLPSGVRSALVALALAAHAALAWALLDMTAAPRPVSEAAPLQLDLVAAPPQPAPAPLPTPTRPRVPHRVPPPIVAAPSVALPAPDAFIAPPPVEASPTATADAPPIALPAPAAAPAATPEPTPVPAPVPAPVPRSVPSTAVRYLVAPAPLYPAASRRLGEAGQVLVRVEIDAAGRPRQLRLQRSSGSARLDEAALVAVREARFEPYTDQGVPQVVWTTVPIVFELE